MKYTLFFFIVCLASCVKRTNPNEDSITFVKYYKDSAYLSKFNYSHEGRTFRYTSLKDTITIAYDSIQKHWWIKDRVDSSTLFLQVEGAYRVNHTDFSIHKLIRDKGVTDGELTYIVDENLGLLVSKSNTWRSAMFLKTNDLVLSTAIFEIVTDPDLYPNEIDFKTSRFTPPTITGDTVVQ